MSLSVWPASLLFSPGKVKIPRS